MKLPRGSPYVAHSEIIGLRETAEDDLQYVVGIEHDADNREHIVQWSYERHRAALADDDLAHLVVELRRSRKPVGFIILKNLLGPERSLELLRIVIDQKRRGYGREALRLVKRLAFNDLSVHRLWLDVTEGNLRAQRLYRGEGFFHEGTLRDALLLGQQYHSLHVFAIVEADYRR